MASLLPKPRNCIRVFLEKRKCFKGTSLPHSQDSRSGGLQWASRPSMVQMGAIRRNFYSGKIAVIVTLCLMLEFVGGVVLRDSYFFMLQLSIYYCIDIPFTID